MIFLQGSPKFEVTPLAYDGYFRYAFVWFSLVRNMVLKDN